MAITFTKKFTGTFANGRPGPNSPDSPHDILAPYIAEQVASGNTDGVIEVIDANSSVRLWVDQTSAQAYADQVVSAVTQLGRTDFSYTITNI